MPSCRKPLNADPLCGEIVPTCSYNLQLAHHAHQESDEKGIAPASEILAAFDAFDWPGQVAEANRIQEISPTFSVRDVDHDRLFWVSGCGSPEEFEFVCDYTYIGTKSKLFGLLKSQGPVGPTTRDLTFEEARRGIEFFVDGRHDDLLRLVSA